MAGLTVEATPKSQDPDHDRYASYQLCLVLGFKRDIIGRYRNSYVRRDLEVKFSD